MRMLEKGQSQSPGKEWNRIQISVPMCLLTRRSSVRRPCCSSRSSRPGTAALFLPEPTKRWRQLPCDFIYSLATVQEASLHPILVSSAVAALVFSGFLSGLTGFHSSSISHCWLGLSSFSGIITTWSLSYVLPPGEQEKKQNCLWYV